MACHGPDGVGGSAFAPTLRGLQAEVIWKELHDYRTGNRQFNVMNAIARARRPGHRRRRRLFRYRAFAFPLQLPLGRADVI